MSESPEQMAERFGLPVELLTARVRWNPAPVAAEGTDELREQVAAWEFARHAPARYWGTATLAAEQEDAYEAAEEVMALPALAPLLAERDVLLAKVQAVEALAAEWEVKAEGHADAVARYVDRNAAASLRRALDGDRG